MKPFRFTKKSQTLLWNLACAGADNPEGVYRTDEYGKLVALGFSFVPYKNRTEWITNLSPEEQADFAFNIYYSEFSQ